MHPCAYAIKCVITSFFVAAVMQFYHLNDKVLKKMVNQNKLKKKKFFVCGCCCCCRWWLECLVECGHTIIT